MTTIFYCQKCSHYMGSNLCLAFPDGIPQEIFEGEATHEEVLETQDGDFVHEPVE